mmetsp:Transcript_17242/g.25864  ORF Transcript_17242/g.25864 Transcript_17242/m.25864 type:complete len:402 (+) Transcript_17242:103-1308(+)
MHYFLISLIILAGADGSLRARILRGVSPRARRKSSSSHPSICTEFIQVRRSSPGRLERVVRRIRSRRKNKVPAGPSLYRRMLQSLGWSADGIREKEQQDEIANSNSVAATSSKVVLPNSATMESTENGKELLLDSVSITSEMPVADSSTSSEGMREVPKEVSLAVDDSKATEVDVNAVSSDSKLRWANIGARKSIQRSLGASEDLALFQEFISSPEGINSLLNLEHIRAYDQIGENRYKVYCGSFKLLSWYVEPVLDLQVKCKDGSCVLETKSCTIEGDSPSVAVQNDRFRAAYQYSINWDEEINSQGEKVAYIRTRGELDMQLQIYSFPFTRLPTSAVEAPGNKLMQALLKYLLPAFLDALLTDFHSWKEIARPVEPIEVSLDKEGARDRKNMDTGSIRS